MLEKQSSTQRKGETVPQCTDSSLNSQHWARLMPEGKKSILSSMYSDHLPLPFKVKTENWSSWYSKRLSKNRTQHCWWQFMHCATVLT